MPQLQMPVHRSFALAQVTYFKTNKKGRRSRYKRRIVTSRPDYMEEILSKICQAKWPHSINPDS
eukprot:2103604-Amphidinium_carterae.1